jgi:hypothetical protein
MENNEISIVVQFALKFHIDLANVPVNYAKTDEAKKLIAAVAHAHGAAVRPSLLAPGTRKDIIEISRKAVNETVKDPELLGEAAKANLAFNPNTAKDLEKISAVA